MANELSKVDGAEPRIFAPLHYNRNFSLATKFSNKSLYLPALRPKFFRLTIIAGTFLARKSINSFQPNILHETYFCETDFSPNGVKKVITVHDMIHEKFSGYFKKSTGTSNPKRVASQRADHIICVSESTRQDLIDICHIPEEKTSVIHHGVDNIFTATPLDSDHLLNLPVNFILYVGKREGYKNFIAFLRAFAASTQLKEYFSIVCFGGGELSPSELALAGAVGLRPGQLIVYFGDDALLASIYRQASALVYPSLYEGFGFPPLEAMASGCPVICSNTSSLPEVVGTAGEYFDPLSQESIKKALEAVVFSTKRSDDLIAAGYLQASKFSWEKCAKDTMKEYQKLL